MTQIRKLNLVSIAGLVLVFGGLIGITLGIYLNGKASDGLKSLDAVYAAQARYMSYDDDGNFTDRGTVEGGNAILSLIEDDWAFPLDRGNLDPNDTLVNTPDELMVQYGTISYHTLHGTQTVVLDEDVEYKGEFFAAGTYEVPVDGRYFSDLDRSHPLEGPVRNQAWTPLAFGLLGNLIGRVDQIVTGGGMANTFLAARGIDVGKSLCEHDLAGSAREIMARAEAADQAAEAARRPWMGRIPRPVRFSFSAKTSLSKKNSVARAWPISARPKARRSSAAKNVTYCEPSDPTARRRAKTFRSGIKS